MKAMRSTVAALMGSAVFAWAEPMHAYEVDTHSAMSMAAFQRSAASGHLPFDAASNIEGTREILQGLLQNTVRQSPREWVGDGAWDEDDYVSGQAFRFRNHFYNPLNGEGLSVASNVLGAVQGLPSPEWGLEHQSGEDFSYRAARQSFLQAVTDAAPIDREHAWAKTFYALGHVIHLIQDMAQPQHTRNDSHGPRRRPRPRGRTVPTS